MSMLKAKPVLRITRKDPYRRSYCYRKECATKRAAPETSLKRARPRRRDQGGAGAQKNALHWLPRPLKDRSLRLRTGALVRIVNLTHLGLL